MRNKQNLIDQWSAGNTPKVWRSDNMVSNPQDENTDKANKNYYPNIFDPDFDELEFYDNISSLVSSYPQNWPAYNSTQTNEYAMFQDILIELIDTLLQTRYVTRRGRPFNDLKDMLFCCVMRAYYGKSSRRCVSFLDYALNKGYILKKPHFNTILNYYKDGSLTSLLKHLIEQSGTPLRNLELDFTIDSSGFSTNLFGRWLNIRIQADGYKRIWKKAHVTSGVISNIITAINITPGYFADSPQLKDLVKTTAKTFEIRELSGDKAYSSRKNLQTVAELGGIPFIPFKENATGRSRGSMVWGQMKKFYDEYRDFFMLHYHKRSNAESVFSMIKRKFGHKLYSKSEVGQINEILCKALAHNICVLIQEYFENNAKLNFFYCAKKTIVTNRR